MSHGPPPPPHESRGSSHGDRGDTAGGPRDEGAQASNGVGITGVVFGGVAVLVAVFSEYFLSFVLWALVALVLGLIALDRAKHGLADRQYGQWAIGLAIASGVIEYVWYLALFGHPLT